MPSAMPTKQTLCHDLSARSASALGPNLPPLRNWLSREPIHLIILVKRSAQRVAGGSKLMVLEPLMDLPSFYIFYPIMIPVSGIYLNF